MYKLTPFLTVSLVGKLSFSGALPAWLQVYISSHGPVFFQRHVCYIISFCAMTFTVSKRFYVIIYPKRLTALQRVQQTLVSEVALKRSFPVNFLKCFPHIVFFFL